MFIRQNHHSYCMPIFDCYSEPDLFDCQSEPDSKAYFTLTHWELNGFNQWLQKLTVLNAQFDNEKDKAEIKTYAMVIDELIASPTQFEEEFIKKSNLLKQLLNNPLFKRNVNSFYHHFYSTLLIGLQDVELIHLAMQKNDLFYYDFAYDSIKSLELWVLFRQKSCSHEQIEILLEQFDSVNILNNILIKEQPVLNDVHVDAWSCVNKITFKSALFTKAEKNYTDFKRLLHLFAHELVHFHDIKRKGVSFHNYSDLFLSELKAYFALHSNNKQMAKLGLTHTEIKELDYMVREMLTHYDNFVTRVFNNSNSQLYHASNISVVTDALSEILLAHNTLRRLDGKDIVILLGELIEELTVRQDEFKKERLYFCKYRIELKDVVFKLSKIKHVYTQKSILRQLKAPCHALSAIEKNAYKARFQNLHVKLRNASKDCEKIKMSELCAEIQAANKFLEFAEHNSLKIKDGVNKRNRAGEFISQ